VPKVSKETASEASVAEGYEGHSERLENGYTVTFESYSADLDVRPLLRGLPGDRCHCPHWGYVISGELRFDYGDRTETFVAGDAYWVLPGHVTWIAAGTEVVEFSPTADRDRTIAQIERNVRDREEPP